MADLIRPTPGISAFLMEGGTGRQIIRLKPKERLFVQGTPAQSLYYLYKGRVKMTVASRRGKGATIALFSAGDFVGEDSLERIDGPRIATATAITACTALQIDREEMIRAIHEDRPLFDMFLKVLLRRTLRAQADLVDQLFNSSEQRLARILLLMARYGTEGEPESLIPYITQATLAEMIGTTRSRVNFFMNRFRKLGFVEYKSRIWVRKELLSVIQDDESHEHHADRFPVLTAQHV